MFALGRAEEIRASGLQIISPHGDATIEPNLIIASDFRSAYDIVFLSVKSYGLVGAMNDFAPAVGPRTVILPVLNGMRHMDVLERGFGKETLLGGACLVATQLDANGGIIQLADFQSLTYGELDGKQTPRVETVDRAFRGIGFDASVSSHIPKTCGKNGSSSPAWVPSPSASGCRLNRSMQHRSSRLVL